MKTQRRVQTGEVGGQYMNTTSLDLLILGDSSLLVGPLSKFLNNRFGRRITMSTFFDVDKCMRSINEHSHVIILNYFLGKRIRKDGFDILNSINKKYPGVDVIMISSDKNIIAAIEIIKKEAGDYIARCERILTNKLPLLSTAVFSPIKTSSLIPRQKITNDYKVQDYLLMFVVAFISIGVFVITGLIAMEIFN